MAQDSIGSIRSATFSVTRRGYDKHEVDGYLSKLADWLESGGADQAAQEVVRRELERIGQKTGKILTAAEDAARSIKADAEDTAAGRVEDSAREADAARSAAEKYSDQTRSEADNHAAKARKAADEYAEATRADAERKANSLIEEGKARRREIEHVITDLEKRRDAVLAALEKLSTELQGTATSHKAVGDQAESKPAAKPKPAGAAEDAPTQKVRRTASVKAAADGE